MLTVKDAVQKAFLFVQDIYAPEIYQLELEETELSEDEKYWLITVSFDVPFEAVPASQLILGSKEPKTKFKTMKIDIETGKVISMKIREVYEPDAVHSHNKSSP